LRRNARLSIREEAMSVIRTGRTAPTRRGFLVVLFSAFLALALFQAPGAANAQAVKQVQLSEKQVQGFIAAQKEMAAVAEKMQGDKPDPKLQAQLEAIAKKYGFANFAEYDDVAANISLIVGGIDPQTKKFLEPRDQILKEIEAVKADKTMSAADKKKAIDELNEALKTAEPIKFKENIALVTKYYEKLDAVMQQG
jgi:hypothetical protein